MTEIAFFCPCGRRYFSLVSGPKRSAVCPHCRRVWEVAPLGVNWQGRANSAIANVQPIHGVMITPPIDEDFWLLRVKVSKEQAIVGFPKFMQLGIGFAVEADWNTNLPSRVTAERIFEHIKHNKGDTAIPDARCIEAIRMVQEAWNKLDQEQHV